MNRLVTASVVTVLLVGCNTILNNEPGTLASDDGTSNDTTTPPPSSSSSSGGSSSSGNTGGQDASTPIDLDAGQPTPPDGGTCATGQMLCNNACVSITDPLYGCGNPACTPCKLDHATAACQGRTCAVAACDPGFADCDKNPANGCEVDLSKATSCGACNAVCPATAPVCAPSGAGFACTTGCTAAAPLLCGAECVDPATSENHCGACNHKCPDVPNGTTACTAGACSFTCKPGYNKCGGACTVATDPAACGPACTVCPTPANATPMCTNDACTFSCAAGFADCNLNPADGCESQLATDAANCGLCGRACPAGSTCSMGACTPPPDAGAPPP
jgi:hypothetical protein